MIRNMLAALGTVMIVAGCTGPEDAPAVAEVNLYTAHQFDGDKELYRRFTEQTGIKINRIEGDADDLVARITSEGAGSPVDVLITADSGALWRAQQAGLLQPMASATIQSTIPAVLRDPQDHWFGFSRQARILAYDPARVQPAEIPDYASLATPRFMGKICVGGAENIYDQSLVSALIEAWGAEKTDQWVKAVVANLARPSDGDDRDQFGAVAAGVCEVALGNSDTYLRLLSSDAAADTAIKGRVAITFPSLDGKGTVVNAAGGGLARYAPHRDSAIKLLEFFASAPTQQYIAASNGEFPASANAMVAPPMDAFIAFANHPTNIAANAARQAEAKAMMIAAGWR